MSLPNRARIPKDQALSENNEPKINMPLTATQTARKKTISNWYWGMEKTKEITNNLEPLTFM